MEKFKFCFGDHDEIIEAENWTKALNKAINNDPSLLGWVKKAYKWEGNKWRSIYFNKPAK